MDLPPSPEFSIIKNGPTSFKGRKVGVLVTDGVDLKLVNTLRAAAKNIGADVAIVCPTISGVDASDGTHIKADGRLNGTPSVVFDAVAILTSSAGAKKLSSDSNAKDFVSDAYSHLKFIAFNSDATPLLEKVGVATSKDEGVVQLKDATDADTFLSSCKKLRVWAREPKTKMAAL